VSKPRSSRPRILVNVASTLDGKIDTALRRGTRISSAADKNRVDRLRASADAVMVGGNTLLNEDPSLTIKSAELRAERRRLGKPENPLKVAVVTCIGEEDLPPGGDFLTAAPGGVLLFTTPQTSPATVRRLEAAGAQVHVSGEARVDLPLALDVLYSKGIRALLVEGGTLLAEFFRLDAVDGLTLCIAPRIFGGSDAPTLADGLGFNENEAPHCRLLQVEKLDDEGGVVLQYEVIHQE
jgi:2,5-diamino-6-(ribosylamino)-4(3H)-pyrimidinone 5'-phosphate reductase